MDEARRRKELLRLFTTDDLRRFYGQTSSDRVTPIELLHGAKISPRELKTEILRRVRWERFGNCVLLTGAGAAVIAAFEGASGGVQSPSGGATISVLALLVTILVAFVAPLVTWAVAQRQIQVAPGKHGCGNCGSRPQSCSALIWRSGATTET